MNRMINKFNERSRKLTKEAIGEALFKLLKEKDINDIKIVDLVKKAGVSRSAFYRNYNSLDDVLKDFIKINFDELVKSFSYKLSDNWLIVLKFVKKDKDNFITLYNSGYFHFLLDHFNESIDKNNYYLLGWNGFIYNILYNWVANDLKESPEKIYKIILECTKKMAVVINNDYID